MMKGLMDRCMAGEKLVDCLKKKAKAVETKRNELKASWEVRVNKLDVTRKALEESETQAKVLKKVLKDKKGEISLLRKQVCQAKEDEETEFHNSEVSLLSLATAMPTALMSAFIRSMPSFLTWTWLISLDDVA